MTYDRLLNFDSADVLTTRDNDVLAAIAQLDGTIGVTNANVTTMEPVPCKGLLSGRLIGEIAGHYDISSHDYLAHRLSVRRHVAHGLIHHAQLSGAYIWVTWRAFSRACSSGGRFPCFGEATFNVNGP
jgi:hypothetical protein